MGNKDYSEKYNKSIMGARTALRVTGIAAGSLAVVSMLHDSIVINMGIQAFRGLKMAFIGGSAVGAMASVGAVVSALVTKRAEDRARMPDKQPDTAFLKVKGDLDPDTVREELTSK